MVGLRQLARGTTIPGSVSPTEPTKRKAKMPDLNTKPSLTRKLGRAIGSIGVAVAVITLICMTSESLRETANGYFIIGVGLVLLSGIIMLTQPALQWIGSKLSGMRIGH